ncbi:MAG: thiamine phosphate synthase [Planctomycetes bacterium]|nr:thiamine phosphate synthase [Planctomycetota bacterium]
MRSVFRLLDAAVNRVAEGYRVVEDICRFMLDDAASGSALKDARQRLRLAVVEIADNVVLLSERDTEEDLGRIWEGAGEYKRVDLAGIVTANFKRVQEGLRSIEELVKQLKTDKSVNIAKKIEKTRYESYVLEKDISHKVFAKILDKINFTLIFDPAACAMNPWELLNSALNAGVDSVQFRVKGYFEKEQELLDLARKTQEICRKYDVPLIINDRADWALILCAEGLHVGQKDLAVADARRILRINQVLGLSIANDTDLGQAQESGADYFGVGALFETITKQVENTLGVDLYKKTLKILEKPVFGLGGINEENLLQVKLAAGDMGKPLRICVSSAILRAKNPGKVVENMRRIMDE